MKLNKMIRLIEQRYCIRKIWRCRAGWGMTFVREHDVPPAPSHPLASDNSAEIRRKRKTLADWRREREDLERTNTVVHRYHSTLSKCVRAEYKLRVVEGIAP